MSVNEIFEEDEKGGLSCVLQGSPEQTKAELTLYTEGSPLF